MSIDRIPSTNTAVKGGSRPGFQLPVTMPSERPLCAESQGYSGKQHAAFMHDQTLQLFSNGAVLKVNTRSGSSPIFLEKCY